MNRLFSGLLFLATFSLLAQPSSFVYQGRLQENGAAANGTYEFRFGLFDNATNELAALTNSAVAVSNGLFTTTLTFPAYVFNGNDRELELGVRTNGSAGSFVTLAPHQPIASAPYAIKARAAENLTGAIQNDWQLPSSIARLNNSQTYYAPQSFTYLEGNGGGLTNLPVGSLVPNDFRTPLIWGYDDLTTAVLGLTNIPPGLTNVIAVSAGGAHNLVIENEPPYAPGAGRVVAWGDNSFGQTNLSGIGARAVAAGGNHSLAINTAQMVVAWGNNLYGQTNVPASMGIARAVAAGWDHSVALRYSGGTVVAWGRNNLGQTNVPGGLSNVVAIAAGGDHSLALRSDGTVAAWGDNTYGQTNVPAGLTDAMAIGAGSYHSLVVRSNGTVLAWGRNLAGETNVPIGLTNVIAVSGGSSWSLALKNDATVVVWGNGFVNPPPPSLNKVVNVSELGTSGISGHAALIKHEPSAPLAWLDGNNEFKGNVQVDGWLSGNAAGLTNLDASQLTTGVVPDASLGANIPRLNYPQNNFSGALSALSFSGSASNLTSLNATNLVGIISDARLSTNIPRLNTAANFSAALTASSFSGNGSNLTSLNATNLTGTISDSRLSSNIPRLNGSPAFSSDVRLGDTKLWFRGGSDTFHGLGWYSSGTFAGSNPDGPVLFGCAGGALGSACSGQKIALKWDSSNNVQCSGNVSCVSLTQTSDRNAKENFAPIDPREILRRVASLPLSTWNYTNDSTAVRHLGPMAQDFRAAFELGQDDKHINTIDQGGVALAAIQGLNQIVQEKNAKIESLEKRVSQLEQLVRSLAKQP